MSGDIAFITAINIFVQGVDVWPRRPDRSSVLEILIAGALIAVALRSRRRPFVVRSAAAVPRPAQPLGLTSKYATDSGRIDDPRDFRLLLTIIAGVALGAAAAALPRLMSTQAPRDWLITAWLLWATGVAAVILTYLSTLTGSKLLRNQIDLAHTASLIAVFLAECGMFAALAMADAQNWFVLWFVSFAAFSAAATVAILLVIWKLSAWWRVAGSAMRTYRREQWSDAVLAGLISILSVVYLNSFPEPSGRSAVIASGVVLTSMIAACMKQSLERRQWRRRGLI